MITKEAVEEKHTLKCKNYASRYAVKNAATCLQKCAYALEIWRVISAKIKPKIFGRNFFLEG